MTVSHDDTMRSALADEVDNQINTTGSGTAKLVLRDGSNPLVTFNLQNPAFGAALSGVITLQGTPITATALGFGTADNFQILDRDGTPRLSGSVTATGGGGDMEVTDTNVAAGQACSLDALIYTTT